MVTKTAPVATAKPFYAPQSKQELPHSAITERIIQAGFEVYKTLGPGFDAVTYQKGLILEMEEAKMNFDVQRPIKVYYKNRIVNEYVIDLLVEHNVIVEVLCEKEVTQLDIKRLKSYLNAAKLDVGLILNFGAHMLEIKRVKP